MEDNGPAFVAGANGALGSLGSEMLARDRDADYVRADALEALVADREPRAAARGPGRARVSQALGLGLKTGMGLGASAGMGLVIAATLLVHDPTTFLIDIPAGASRMLRVVVFLVVALGTGRSMTTDGTSDRTTVLGGFIGLALVLAVMLGAGAIWVEGVLGDYREWLLWFVAPVALVVGGVVGVGLLVTSRPTSTSRRVHLETARIGSAIVVTALAIYFGTVFAGAPPGSRIVNPLMLICMAPCFFFAAAGPTLERSSEVSTAWRVAFALIALVLVVELGTTGWLSSSFDWAVVRIVRWA
jgi:hypothetical protein